MTQDERILALNEIITRQGKVTLDFICQRFGISVDSARRDLVRLSRQPGILRIRGGALYQPEKPVGRSYDERAQPDAVKSRLARAAVTLIQPHEVILLDTGSTLAELTRRIEVEATLITNSIDILAIASHQPGLRSIMLGGEFNPFNRAIYTPESVRQLQGYQADKAFIGVPAFSTGGVSCEQEVEATFKCTLAGQAAYTICIAEHAKFGQRLLYPACRWDEIDCVITDQAPPPAMRQVLEAHDVHVWIVEEGEC